MEQQNKTKGLVSYFTYKIEERIRAKANCFNYDIALKHLQVLTLGKELPFNEITYDWFESLKKYFKNAKGLRSGKELSSNSVNSYFSIITSVARQAANDGLITHEIINKLTNIKPRISLQPAPLSFNELQRLATASCKSPVLKKAFLFSCLTGIQWKDLEILKWNQIRPQADGSYQIVSLRNGEMILPISIQARELLANSGFDDQLVFEIHYSSAMVVTLNKWALRAGITRNITFHTARQTFGRLLMAQGVDLEMISDLLGHKHLRSTTKFLSTENNKPIITSHYRFDLLI